MKTSTNVLIVVIVIALISIGINVWQYKVPVTRLVDQLNLEKAKNRQYMLQEDRVDCITKSLMLAYSLSKWEAHYYAVMFNDFATNYSIPWEIYAAIIRIESNFKCTLVSPKGAKGLWQLLEGTGKEQADELGIEYVKEQTIWNDFINFILGATYISKNIKAKGLEGGVKSYLGGPSYLVSIKYNKDAGQYISEYKTTVWREYKNLCYIYRGVVGELNKYSYAEIHKSDYTDSINVDIVLFNDTNITKNDTALKPQVVAKTKPMKKVKMRGRIKVVKADPSDSVTTTLDSLK
jgi:hypothetical protein